jgi:uncharacterized OB-fold protein
MTDRSRGVVFTETIVWSAPEAYVTEVPYQLAIVEIEDTGRCTVRILGDRVEIGDHVEFAGNRGGVAFFRKLPVVKIDES